jgi:methylmalonyl-CoA/ethylmalonyl-CoA epimerase
VIKRIDHVAIAVHGLDATLKFFADTLGLPLSHVADEPEQAARVAFFPLDGGEVELVEPTSADSGLARWLERHGEGLHHLCLVVDDLDAVLVRLRARGVQLINETPVVNSAGRRLAFIHPKAAHGVLIELYEERTSE